MSVDFEQVQAESAICSVTGSEAGGEGRVGSAFSLSGGEIGLVDKPTIFRFAFVKVDC